MAAKAFFLCANKETKLPPAPASMKVSALGKSVLPETAKVGSYVNGETVVKRGEYIGIVILNAVKDLSCNINYAIGWCPHRPKRAQYPLHHLSCRDAGQTAFHFFSLPKRNGNKKGSLNQLALWLSSLFGQCN